MKFHEMETLEFSVEEISDCMLKQFALLVGTELVKLKNEEKWNQKILELIKGV